ncbi:PilW family protein [Anaerobaca lacustris]|uniref:Type II secretion system protein n=1 Tax=Anaerobaca lacustris TaxID=3044600 RepID=A0AAW6TQ43_9BACT|nr:type II secretion system protein [Sedimentisphaerales bacterium M17dextr]
MKPETAIRHQRRGFTLAELLVTLVVTAIVLSAVATLAFALRSGVQAGSDAAEAQAQLRLATLHITESVRLARMVCAAPGNDLVLWVHTERDNSDHRINVNELVYIERGDDLDIVGLCWFDAAEGSNAEVSLADLALAQTKANLLSNHDHTQVTLVEPCRNVQFGLWDGDGLMLNPATDAVWKTRRLAIAFERIENGAAGQYQIGATLLASAEHLINDAGDGLVSEDDDV